MNRSEFLEALAKRLQEIPTAEREKSLQYYDEIIRDRIEDGVSEEEAVLALGDLDSIVKEITEGGSLTTFLQKQPQNAKNTPHSWIWVTAIILGSPL